MVTLQHRATRHRCRSTIFPRHLTPVGRPESSIAPAAQVFPQAGYWDHESLQAGSLPYHQEIGCTFWALHINLIGGYRQEL